MQVLRPPNTGRREILPILRKAAKIGDMLGKILPICLVRMARNVNNSDSFTKSPNNLIQ